LKELLERFSNNIEVYKRAGYSEENTRNDFINKFFAYLGWDMDNASGASEDFREVILEDPIVIHGKPQFPDYSFKIGRERQFFVEAKKPGVNIFHDSKPAFQLRRYAYTAGLPISILTDFEELSIYDTSIKPNESDAASIARIFHCKYTEYEKHWDFLNDTISKSAVWQGKLKKYTTDNTKKKGTQTVDKELLKLIESWRFEIAKNLALRNKELNIYQINEAVQLIIDRIIFLRMAEDRNTEVYGYLQKTIPEKEIYKSLVKYFTISNRKYNSGLFAPKPWLDNLTIDDKILKAIINDLYYPMPYEFSVLPIEILGQIYEQFLGKTIVLSSRHVASVEEKPEVRKAGGVYYTPKYIVDYIVENTVGKKIENKAPKDIESLTILDPACGSGSFLVGAFKFLLNYHQEYYTKPDNIKKAVKEGKIYSAGKDDYRLTIREKKKILLNNIYGVDIDSQAVEVTKLSLLLTLMEGEIVESRGELFLKSISEALLPNLDNNIKCGNSLIGTDFYKDKDLQLFDIHEQRKINCFDWEEEFPHIFKGKIEKFDKDYLSTHLTKGAEKAKEAIEISKSAYEYTNTAIEYARKFNLVKEEVPVYNAGGGFDVVIGNPPYIKLQTMMDSQQERLPYLKSNYISASSNNIDIYLIFIEKAYQLINFSGIAGYILPHKFFQAQMGENIRKYLSDNKAVKQIVSFGANQIFESATTYTCLFFIDKIRKSELLYKEFKLGEEIENKLNQSQFINISVEQLNKDKWNFFDNDKSSLFRKLNSMPIKLKDITRKIFVGLQTSADNIYVLERLEYSKENDIISVYSRSLKKNINIERDFVKPFLMGKDVKRYSEPLNKNYVIFPYKLENGKAILMSDKEIKTKYPLGWEYLLENKSDLENREKGKMKNDRWYAYIYPKNLAEFDTTKIMTPYLSDRCNFTYDFKGNLYHTTKAYSLAFNIKNKSNELYYLGLFNAKVIWYFISNISSVFRGGFYVFATDPLELIPLPNINLQNILEKAQHDRMVQLVEQMFEAQKKAHDGKSITETDQKLINQRINILDKQIDALVYELYGLTEDEIKIVEGEG
jgi:adenine-specific DNA-methyltransferase